MRFRGFKGAVVPNAIQTEEYTLNGTRKPNVV